MTTQADLKPVRASMMNAVHDLALLVARDEGLFSDEGLDVEIVTTPGTAQINAEPYTRKRFAATYEWMQSYPGLVAPGATYDTVVDNRAWE